MKKSQQVEGIELDDIYRTQEKYYPTKNWRVSTPEAQGMDSSKLAELFDKINDAYPFVNSTLILRNGYIVAEKYNNGYSPNIKQYIYSATKSILSGIVGIALDQELIHLDDKITDIFSDRDIKEPDERKNKITIEHLLQMRDGFNYNDNQMYGSLLASEDPIQFVLDLPMKEEPGFSLNYNSANSHLLSAIVQEKSGMKTDEFAKEHLFEPLGISNYYFAELQGVSLGANGLMLTPRDFAKFGQLYLNGGEWEGKQIISKEWIKASTSNTSDEKMYRSYYGYHWYVNDIDGQPVYYALGSFGQFLFVLPELNIVVVSTAGKDAPPGFDGLIDLIEPYIIGSVTSDESIKENNEGYEALLAASQNNPEKIEVATTQIFTNSINEVNDIWYSLDSNKYDYKNISMTFDKERAKFSIEMFDDITETIDIGFNQPIVNNTKDGYITATGNWEDKYTLKIMYKHLEALYDYSWTIKFSENYQNIELKEVSEYEIINIKGKVNKK